MSVSQEMLELATKIDQRDQMIVLSPRERDLAIEALRAHAIVLYSEAIKPMATKSQASLNPSLEGKIS